MFSALLYLQFTSLKNRLTRQVLRLKQPKYLVMALVGGAYIYFYFFRMLIGRASYGQSQSAPFQMDPVLIQSVGALIVLVVLLLAWVLPNKRAALTFSEAEIAFLFPAPVTRKTLIHYKLLRSQFSILFTTFFLILFFRHSGGHLMFRIAGWWLILMTVNLHMIGASFALTALMDRGISTWKRRAIVMSLALAMVVAVVVWTLRTLPPLTDDNIRGMDAFMNYGQQALTAGPLLYLLFPFRLMVAPYLATDAGMFLHALWPAMLLLAIHYWWVIRSDVAFEEASIEASKRQAERVTAVRSGKSVFTANKKLKGRRAPFNLLPAGQPSVALLWKNLISAGQGFSRRMWLTLVWVTTILVVSLRHHGPESNWPLLLGIMAAALTAMSVLFGPQMARQDLRQDIALADLLKTYPMRGWQVVLGEILAPAVILTAIQWLMLIIAVGFLSQVKMSDISSNMVFSIGFGAAILLPMFNLISLQVPNAAVLLFPGWVRGGKDAPQGIEATGQRLVFALGQFVAFIVALIPASGVFAVILFTVQYGAGSFVPAIPLAAMGGTLVLAVEAALGILWLGKLFERFDVSAEQGA